MRRPTFLLTFFFLSRFAAAEERRLVTHPYARLGAEANLTASISLGDVDGDGDLDAVVANGRHWAQQNYVFLNDGRGFFRTVRRLGEELATSYRAALADFDGDGDLDVVVGNDRTTKNIYENDGKGNFSHRGSFGRDDVPTRNLVIADMDGDGARDILVTNRGAPNYIYFNDGHGQFARDAMFGSERDATIAVAAFDLNDDGTLELALANRDGQENFVLIGDERIGFGTGSDESRGIAVGDVDGDGRLDLVTANIGEPNGIFFGDGTGVFPRERLFGREDGASYAVALADLDLDGTLDIIIANNEQSNAVFFNSSNGELRELRFAEADDVSYNLAVGDVNGDGYPDVVVASSGPANVVYFNAPVERSARSWPSFRGPNASGLADGLDLPDEWDGEGSVHVEWKTAIPGLGHSSPIFWGERVFLTTAVSENPTRFSCTGSMAASTGGRTCRATVSASIVSIGGVAGFYGSVKRRAVCPRFKGIEKTAMRPRPLSPTVSASWPISAPTGFTPTIWTASFYGSMTSGWSMPARPTTILTDWGPASSPIIYESLVILLVDQQRGRSFMAAFDVETGEPVWRVARDVISSFSTPALFDGPTAWSSSRTALSGCMATTRARARSSGAFQEAPRTRHRRPSSPAIACSSRVATVSSRSSLFVTVEKSCGAPSATAPT